MSAVLAISTSTEAASVAIVGDGVEAMVRLRAGRRHVEALVPAVQYLLATSGLSWPDLSAVAVDTGPGLFTGLRVGMSTAGALAAAAVLPTVGVSSLDVLAATYAHHPGPVAAVIDARRGEVFWSWYSRCDLSGRRVASEGPRLATPEAVASALAALAERTGPEVGPVLAVGDGAARYAETFQSVVAAVATADPDPVVLARMAATEVEAGRTVPAGRLHPSYLREADAVANFPVLTPVPGGPGGTMGAARP